MKNLQNSKYKLRKRKQIHLVLVIDERRWFSSTIGLSNVQLAFPTSRLLPQSMHAFSAGDSESNVDISAPSTALRWHSTLVF